MVSVALFRVESGNDKLIRQGLEASGNNIGKYML